MPVPDTIRVYNGVPYLHAFSSPGSYLISFLDGSVVRPRNDTNWLVGGSLPKTMQDGQYGYDAWWFYEEPEYSEPVTWHGDTVIASVPTAIHVADGQVEEVDGCPEGQYKIKGVFTVREIASGVAVSGATVSVAVVATCDGAAISRLRMRKLHQW